MYSLTLTGSLLMALSAVTLASAAPNGSTLNTTPQASDMNITLFSGNTCNAKGNELYLTTPLPYNVQVISTDITDWTFASYKLSGPTTLQEQLDFSGRAPGKNSPNGIPEQCAVFLETSSPDSNGHALDGDKCYGLLHGPATCVRFTHH